MGLGIRDEEKGERDEEQGARSKEQGARSKEQGTTIVTNVNILKERSIYGFYSI